MKTYEIEGYFGYWGMHSTVYIEANSYAEATDGLKAKVMKAYEARGKGANQNNFRCKVTGYRVIQELKPFKKFKTAKVYK